MNANLVESFPLEGRDGLPDALRVLLDAYPRAVWEHHPGFDGLLTFWLERHMMFRQILAAMTDQTESYLDGNRDGADYARRIRHYAHHFVTGLHQHHTIEDTHFFPAMTAQDARIGWGFQLLEADHHAIDAHLNRFVMRTNDTLQNVSNKVVLRARAGKFHAGVVDLTALLDRHLTDEEELVVPLVLEHGAGFLGH